MNRNTSGLTHPERILRERTNEIEAVWVTEPVTWVMPNITPTNQPERGEKL
jgi:hypothetical protein